VFEGVETVLLLALRLGVGVGVGVRAWLLPRQLGGVGVLTC